MSASFRAVVKEAFVATVKKAEKPDEYPAVLAEELRGILRREGYAIHASDGCVRLPPKARELGRPMTEAELAAVGLRLENGTAGEPESPPAGKEIGMTDPADRTASATKKGSES